MPAIDQVALNDPPSVPLRHAEGSLYYESRLWFPFPPDDVFDFFSRVENLDRVTPQWFSFKVRSPGKIDIRSGMEIDYLLSWRKLPIRWTSRIVTFNPPEDFSYEQARGPYRRFFHDHIYREHSGGTLAVDRIFYRPWGGALIDRFFVRKDLDRIFEFRKKKSERLLPLWLDEQRGRRSAGAESYSRTSEP